MSHEQYFDTDGHRATVGSGLITPEGAFSAGLAVGAMAAEHGPAVVPVGWDTRQSSEWLQSAVAAGITAAGADAIRLGVLPTPGVAYITGTLAEARLGVMITASHNPASENGIKVLAPDGGKLTQAAQDNLSGRLFRTLPPGRPLGKQLDGSNLRRRYEDFLITAGEEEAAFRGLHIAIDTAHGAASGIAQRIFSRLGATVFPLFDRPNGQNINKGCGAANTNVLAETVRSTDVDLGVAFDGDADRVQLIDAQGRLLHGDHILYILAMTDKTPHQGVVGTIMSNQGFENALAEQDIPLRRTNVGDRFVLEELRRSGWRLGGEQSGHIILPEYLCTGDGMLAAIRTIRQVRQSGRSLAEWYDDLPLFPQTMVNIPLAAKQLLRSPAAEEVIAEYNKALGSSGRLIVRPSGTEKLARVMVEAEAPGRAEALAAEIADRLRAVLPDVS